MKNPNFNEEANRATIAKFEKDIKESKEKVAKLEEEIKELADKEEKLQANYNSKFNRLSKMHESYLQAINSEKQKIQDQIEKLARKEAAVSAAYKKEQDAIDEKIDALLLSKKKLIENRINTSKSSFETKKASIEKKLKTLRDTKKEQTEEYNTSIVEIDNTFKKLRQEQEKKNAELKVKEDTLVQKYESSVADLNTRKQEIDEKQKASLKAIQDAYQAELDQISAQENSIIDTHNNELNGLYNKLNSLTNSRDSMIKQYSDDKERLLNDYNQTVVNYDDEVKKFTQDNENLKNELENKKHSFERLNVDQEQILANKKETLKSITEVFAKQVEETEIALKEKLTSNDEKLQKKYDEYINSIEDKRVKTDNEQAKQIANLQYRLQKEEEQLASREAFLKERLTTKEEESKRVIANLTSDNKGLDTKIVGLSKEYAQRINDMKAELVSLADNNKVSLETKEAELKDSLKNIKNDYSEKKKVIKEEIQSVKANINKINEEIPFIKEGFNNYCKEIEDKKNVLTSKHEETINKLTKERNAITDAINQVVASIENSRSTHAEAMQKLENKKIDAKKKCDENIEILKQEHELALSKSIELQNTRLAKAENDFNNAINDIINNANKTKQELADEAEKKRNEYNEAAAKLEPLTEELIKDYEARIDKLQNQRGTLLAQIQTLKDDYDKELAQYNANKAAIEKEYIDNIAKLDIEQQEKIKTIINDYETAPNAQLEKIKIDYSTKLDEFDKVSKEITSERNKVDASFQMFISSNDKARQEAEAMLADTQSKHNVKVQEKENIIANLNEELDKKQNELNEYNERLNKDIDDLKANHQAKLEELKAVQEEKYNEAKGIYQDKQDLVQRQYDQELDSKRDEIKAKKADYDNMIEESKRRKNKIEADYQTRYSNEVAKTQSIQNDLDKVSADNDFQRTEWQRMLSVAKEEAAAEIANIKQTNEDKINGIRNEYEKYLNDTNNQIANLKQQILNFDQEKVNLANEFDVYRKQKDQEIDSIKKDTEAYIASIKVQVQDIAEKEAIYLNAHDERVATIKKQIAEAMANYEELQRLRPSIIKGEVASEDEDLISKTADFKNRLDNLEKSNVEILEKLQLKRNQALDQIAYEIDDLISGRSQTLRTYENDIQNISKSYEALIRDEISKQQSLNQELQNASESNRNEENEFNSSMISIKDQLVNDKSTLKQLLTSDESMVSVEYGSKIDSANIELKKFESVKDAMIEEVSKTRAIFEEIDDDIAQRKARLLAEYKTRLSEINKLYEKTLYEQKQKYRHIDVMKSDVLDVFKRS